MAPIKQCEWTNCPTRVGDVCCNEAAAPAPAEVPMPEPYATVYGDGYVTLKTYPRQFRTDVVTLEQCIAYAAAREAAAVEPLAKFLQQHEDLWPPMSGSAVEIAIAVIEKQSAERERVRGVLRRVIEAYDRHQDNLHDGLGIMSGRALRDEVAAARGEGR